MKSDRKKPFSQVTSNYLAYHPDPSKPQGRFVKLTSDARKRYEAKGWTFKRVTSGMDYTY